MAASKKPGGYQCETINTLAEDYKCMFCQNVAREPNMTSCCGEHFCQLCISQVIKSNQPCPHCGNVGFTTMLNVKLQSKISALEVYCTEKQRGCDWTGTLGELETHKETSCEYVDVPCPAKCGEMVEKRRMDAHLKTDCVKRDYSCHYCSFKATYEIVFGKHSEECKYFPVQCPNLCGVTCERFTMEDHMKTCQCEEVECELKYAGCSGKFKREDQDSHMEQNTQKHLAMMSATLLKMSLEFEEKLTQKDKEISELKQWCSNEIQRKENQIKSLEQKLEEITDMIKESSDNTIKEVRIFRHPYYFTVHDYSKNRVSNHCYYTPHYRTHPKGYVFLINVHLNGVGIGSGTHISLSFSPTQHMDNVSLKWPAKVTFTIQLLNQHHDQDHVTITTTLVWSAPTFAVGKIPITHTLIKQSDLDGNPRKLTQYLKDDCLQFRISKIEVLSL